MGEQTLQIPHYVDVDPETLQDSFTDEEIAFRDFKNASSADSMGILRVGRVRKSTITGSPATAKSIHCFACPIDRYEYDELLEVIRETYGGGLYRLTGVQPGHKGSKFNRLIEIEEPLKVADATKSGGGGVDSIGVLLESLSNILEKSQERTESLLSRANPQLQNTDPFASMEKMVTMLASLGVIGGGASHGDGLAEIERFIKLKSLIGELGGESGGGDPGFYGMITETIRQFGGPLLMAVQAGAQSGALSRTPPPVARPNARTLEATPETPHEPSEEQMEQLKQLKNVVAILLANAKAGIDAVQFASVVVDQTPDDQLETLHEQASVPEYIDNLIKLNAEVAEYRGWFQKLREEIVRLLDEMVETDLQPDSDGHIVEPSTGAVTGDNNLKAVPDAPIERTPTTEPKPETGGHADDINGDPERSAGDTPNP